MIVIQALLLTVLFESTVVCRHRQQKHRQVKPHFKSVLPSILHDVEDLDELKGNIEQPLMEEEKQEPEGKNDTPGDYKFEEGTGIDIDEPLGDKEEKSLLPKEVIRNLSNTFGHRYLECETMYHYPLKLRLNFLNFWNGVAITDKMAGCALLCIVQKLHMMDEFGKIRVTEAIEFLKANEADEETTQGLIFVMAQCRGIIDDQQLSKDVCAAGLLYSICFRDGIKALGWMPITGTDTSRKNLQDAQDWLLAHLATSNMTQTIPNENQTQNFISTSNHTTNINKTNIKFNHVTEDYDNVTNTESRYEYTTVQTFTDSLTDMIADIASAYFYNVTNKNKSVNTIVSKSTDLSNASMIKDKNMSDITAPDAVKGAIEIRKLTSQNEKNSTVHKQKNIKS